MANRKVLFGLLVLCLSIYLTECRRGGGGRSGGHSSSRGGSSWGKGWGGSSSGSSWSKPSYSSSSGSGSSWGSSGSYKPSTSWNTGSSSSSNSWSKPSYPASTGLSGSGSGSSGSSWGSSGSYKPSTSWNTGSSSGSNSWSKPSYPSSTGLSGSGSGSSGSSWGSGGSYNPSTSWNTGSSSGSNSWSKPSYPSSSSGLSGTGSGSHSYPSGTGLSGGGSKYPSGSYGSGSHSYPSGTGLSGSGTGTNRYPSSSGNGYSNYPKNTYNTNSGYGGTHSYHYIPHTYYTAPQHVYITQYRDSGSRYSDLLTGLTLYNMGRSHSYHDHYYNDYYYRQRYHSTGSSYNNQQQSSYNKPSEDATCTLRIKENGKLEVLKIPCEIVSTFTEGGKKVESDTYVNHTVCTTSITTYKKSLVTNITVTTTELPINTNITANVTSSNSTTITTANPNKLFAPNADVTDQETFNNIDHMLKEYAGLLKEYEGILKPKPMEPIRDRNETNRMEPITTGSLSPITVKSNKTEGNVFTQTVNTTTPTETIVNVTTCTTTQNYTDPLSVRGGPVVDPSNMECSVDIKTKDAHFRNTVECKTLMEYSKMPEPKKEDKPLLPPREKLKSWLQKPPWWMSMFIAV